MILAVRVLYVQSLCYSADNSHSPIHIAHDSCVYQYVLSLIHLGRTSTHCLLALVIPAAYHSAQSHSGGIDQDGTIKILKAPRQVVDGSDLDDEGNHGLRVISRGTAILLLGVYAAYLFFQVSSIICFVETR